MQKKGQPKGGRGFKTEGWRNSCGKPHRFENCSSGLSKRVIGAGRGRR